MSWAGPLFALKIAPSRVRIWSPCNTRFLGSTRVHIPNSISIGAAVFAGLTIVTDRQTDHATPSVTIGHIYIVLQCRLKVSDQYHGNIHNLKHKSSCSHRTLSILYTKRNDCYLECSNDEYFVGKHLPPITLHFALL